MKKKLFRELRNLANKVLGEKETNKIIDETIEEVVKEIKEDKPKKKKRVDK